MSWLLENWFGSKESLEQVKEDIHENLHKEFYLGLSGIENPEQSSTRIASKELFLQMNGPWDSKLEEAETELLQYVHDELPAVVRDEVGIIPFYTHVTEEGYLVLTYIRNAMSRDILLQRVPLVLMTPDGGIVARKIFDLTAMGPLGDMSSRPCEFMFRWDEFDNIPEKEVPLTLAYKKPNLKKADIDDSETGGLSIDEVVHYNKALKNIQPLEDGSVDLQVLDVKADEEENGGLKIVVVFRNGLDKRLEFTEVPIIVTDKTGDSVAKVHYTLENMKVDAKGHKLWLFKIPADSLLKSIDDFAELTAFIPKAKQQRKSPVVAPSANNKDILQ
ncbi:SLAP domain-containing protein [Brevibacillus panacihumi]|uniref:SLAP domain-containing protein n=1 Tax=Brevibacillus panacihumi TaxID=497735 RepID=UPI003D070AAF